MGRGECLCPYRVLRGCALVSIGSIEDVHTHTHILVSIVLHNAATIPKLHNPKMLRSLPENTPQINVDPHINPSLRNSCY